jgi:predicted nucleic acid-binding protein
VLVAGVVVVPVETGVVEVEEVALLVDVEVDELDDGAAELLALAVELPDEDVAVVPPDDGAEAK